MKLRNKTITNEELQDMKGKMVEASYYTGYNGPYPYKKYYVTQIDDRGIDTISGDDGHYAHLIYSSIYDIRIIREKKILTDTLKKVWQNRCQEDRIRTEFEKDIKNIQDTRKQLFEKVQSINMGFDTARIPSAINQVIADLRKKGKGHRPEISMHLQMSDGLITGIWFTINCYDYYSSGRWHNPENTSFIYREYDNTLCIDSRNKEYIKLVNRFITDMKRYLDVQKKSRSFDYSVDASTSISDKGTLDYYYSVDLKIRNPMKATPGNIKKVLQSAINSLHISYISDASYSKSRMDFGTIVKETD